MDTDQQMTKPATELPAVGGLEDLGKLPKSIDRYEVAIRSIMRLENLSADSFTPLLGGSMPIFAVGGDLVLKLFPPPCRANGENEAAVLRVIEQKTTFETPRVIAAGEFDSWRYVVMSRVRGTPLAERWKTMSEAQIERHCEGLGAVVRELHSLAHPEALGYMVWSDFVDLRLTTAKAQQANHGLSASLLAEVDGVLAETAPLLRTGPCVIVHTEFMREHILVGADNITVTGLIDFEPSMLAPAEYDFVAVGIFICEGVRRRWAAFLRGYEHAWAGAMPLSELLMAHTLIHRYSNLPWFMSRTPKAQPPVSEFVTSR